MTMPHLMNCGHSDEGWCLDCVKAMHDETGMTLRDYFAAKAMQGMAPDIDRMANECARECGITYRASFEDAAVECARRAYAIADAMLAERAKGGAL